MKFPSDKLDGIFLLDKPLGLSSHHAMKRTQRLLQAKKGGHTGSLDPLATGMLPLCFGEATKFSRFFLEANKAYAVTMLLGVTTTTGDSEGEAMNIRPVPTLTSDLLTGLHTKFSGTHQQIPPMFSALKFQGQPLYRLARQGKTIERQSRTVTVYHLAFDPIGSGPSDRISFVVECSKGTYIRSLVEQMGEHLGCGAHVVSLRRIWVDPFRNTPMIALSTVEEMSLEQRREHLMSIPTILAPIMPSVNLSPEQGEYIKKGRDVKICTEMAAGWVSLMCSGTFLGIGESDQEGSIKPKRLIEQIG